MRSYATENRERFVRYLSAGIKQPGGPTLLGVEVEHFVVFDDGSPVSYERHDSALGIREVLEYLSAFYPDRAYGTQGDLVGLSGSEGGVWPIRVADLNNAIVSVQTFGMRGKVYGKTLESWEKLLFELAEGALEADEATCLDPLRAFAHDKNWWSVEVAREV